MVAGGAWRRPRMKVYDYNQEFGGNYYQVSQAPGTPLVPWSDLMRYFSR